MTTTKGTKHDKGKRRYDLINPFTLYALADVLTYGAEKYGETNWEQGISSKRLYSAALRHLEAVRLGSDMDPESKLPHLAHAICNLHFWLAFKLDPRLKNREAKESDEQEILKDRNQERSEIPAGEEALFPDNTGKSYPCRGCQQLISRGAICDSCNVLFRGRPALLNGANFFKSKQQRRTKKR